MLDKIMTAEEIFKNGSGLASEYGYNVEVIELSNAIELAKQYAKHKLDEVIQKGYYMSCDDDDKVVDVMDLIEIKNKI